MTINSVDISTFGMLLLKGGDVDFFAFPERKNPQTNDWFEHDGLDVDLSEAYFNARKMTFKFRLKANSTVQLTNRIETIEALLYSAGLKSVHLSNLGVTWQLRFIAISDFKFKGHLSTTGDKVAEFSCEFSEDNPRANISSVTVPISTLSVDNNLLLNGYEFANFGIVVKKIYDTALCIRSPKKGLERTFERRDGVVSDTGLAPKKQARNIVIECRMSAPTLFELWHNWSALFNQLNKYDSSAYKDGIALAVNANVLRCYYKSMTDLQVKATLQQPPVIKFKLNLINHK